MHYRYEYTTVTDSSFVGVVNQANVKAQEKWRLVSVVPYNNACGFFGLLEREVQEGDTHEP